MHYSQSAALMPTSRFDHNYEPMPPSKPTTEGVNMRLKKEDGQAGIFIEPIYEGKNGLRLESPRFAGQIYAEHR